MFERILFRRSDLSRHRNGPYAKERERYLTLLMEEGRALPTLRQIANLLYHRLIEKYVRKAMDRCPSLANKCISPHTIRHTTATHLLCAGVDINTIRAWLGHVSIDTTNIYVEVDLERKAQMLEKTNALRSNPVSKRPWKENPSLMAFLRSL